MTDAHAPFGVVYPATLIVLGFASKLVQVVRLRGIRPSRRYTYLLDLKYLPAGHLSYQVVILAITLLPESESST